MKLRKIANLFLLLWTSALFGTESSGQKVSFDVSPLQMETRYDDNIFRSPARASRTGDWLFSSGVGLKGKWMLSPQWDMGAGWSGRGMLYRREKTQDNAQNDFSLALGFSPGGWSVRYTRFWNFRSSTEANYDYRDRLENVEVTRFLKNLHRVRLNYRFYQRDYHTENPVFQARNFFEDHFRWETAGILFSRWRYLGAVSWRSKQFNRYALRAQGETFEVLNELEKDSGLGFQGGFSGHVGSLLQEWTLAYERIRSNSDGFSHRNLWFSWAAVVRPISAWYVQLFARLFDKRYDRDPFRLPELELGFNDEEGQDLLSLKVTWQLDDHWETFLFASRLHNESETPNRFYIKHLLGFGMLRSF